MADDVALAQSHHGDIRDRLEPPGDFGEPGKTVEEIALIGVAGDHHRRVPTQPRQYHLDLSLGAVLRLVDDDEGIIQRAAAHKPDWGDLDGSLGHQLLDAPAAEPLVQRVVERAQIRSKLLADVAGKEA